MNGARGWMMAGIAGATWMLGGCVAYPGYDTTGYYSSCLLYTSDAADEL